METYAPRPTREILVMPYSTAVKYTAGAVSTWFAACVMWLAAFFQ